MTTYTIDHVPLDVLRYEIMPFASEKNLSLVSKEFSKANRAFEEKELIKFYLNITIELISPELIRQAKGALKEKKYNKELKLLKRIRLRIFGMLKLYNATAYKKLNKEYGKGSISHKKVFEAAEEVRLLVDCNLQKVGIKIRKELINNNIPENNILDENASAQDIRTWFNNPENQETINSVTELNLSELNLTVLPFEISSLTALEKLDLEKNKLIELPDWIGSLIALKDLDLTENNLTKLPDSIGNLIALKVLILKDNKLTKLPETIGKLTALTWLHLENNKLKTLPETIDKLTSLEWLFLKNNELIKLPKMIGNLNELDELDVEKNKLKTLPFSIAKLAGIEITMDFSIRKIYHQLINSFA
jgi:hypothetical protein